MYREWLIQKQYEKKTITGEWEKFCKANPKIAIARSTFNHLIRNVATQNVNEWKKWVVLDWILDQAYKDNKVYRRLIRLGSPLQIKMIHKYKENSKKHKKKGWLEWELIARGYNLKPLGESQ